MSALLLSFISSTSYANEIPWEQSQGENENSGAEEKETKAEEDTILYQFDHPLYNSIHRALLHDNALFYTLSHPPAQKPPQV